MKLDLSPLEAWQKRFHSGVFLLHFLRMFVIFFFNFAFCKQCNAGLKCFPFFSSDHEKEEHAKDSRWWSRNSKKLHFFPFPTECPHFTIRCSTGDHLWTGRSPFCREAHKGYLNMYLSLSKMYFTAVIKAKWKFPFTYHRGCMYLGDLKIRRGLLMHIYTHILWIFCQNFCSLYILMEIQ